MLLLVVLSVLFVLGLGFIATLYALDDIEGRKGSMPRRDAEPIVQSGIRIGHV
jgi:hypothetical protein